MIALLALLAVYLLLSIFNIYSITEYTCLECRSAFHKKSLFGFTIESIEPSDYSRKVFLNNPAHQHHWSWAGWTHEYSLTSVTYACGRRHPIFSLPILLQSDYASRVKPEEMKHDLELIDSKDRNIAEATVDRIVTTTLNSR